MTSDRRSSWFTKEVIAPLIVVAIMAVVSFYHRTESSQIDVSRLKDVVAGHEVRLTEQEKMAVRIDQKLDDLIDGLGVPRTKHR